MKDCNDLGHHEYAEHKCPACGGVHCYACDAGSNVDRFHVEPENLYRTCPHCGHVHYFNE
jgi:predicted RNA-binding Zn-ribbon protein involved in translation (DUF1610 family)